MTVPKLVAITITTLQVEQMLYGVFVTGLMFALVTQEGKGLPYEYKVAVFVYSMYGIQGGCFRVLHVRNTLCSLIS